MYRALFLDRDGVINIDTGYLCSEKNLKFVDGVQLLISKALEKGFKIIIVTNQSGIARGYFTEKEFQEFMEMLIRKLGYDQHKINYLYCPHLPNARIDKYRKICKCRKPNPGMFNQASEQYCVDLKRSIMVGDQITDVEAASAAGVSRIFLLNRSISETFSNVSIIGSLNEVTDYIADF